MYLLLGNLIGLPNDMIHEKKIGDGLAVTWWVLEI
jgi:hypothetical protein